MTNKNALVVVAVLLAGAIALAALAMFAVAKTGLVRVPIFSTFYHGPTPTRVVSSEPISAEAFQASLTQQARSQFVAGRTTTATIRIEERELTGAIKAALVQGLREQDATADQVQIVITPEFLEVSGRLVQGKTTADLRVRLVPVIESGAIRFDATDVRLGDYPIHPSLAHQLAGALFSRDFGTWRISFGDIRFTSLQLQEGVMLLSATPNTP